MRLQTHFEYTVPNLPKNLREKVRVSSKFRRFVQSAVYHESQINWHIVHDTYYNEIRQDAQSSFPEWQPIWTDDDDSIYLVMGDFQDFMLEHVFEPEMGRRLFDFLNAAFEKGSWETWELLCIQLFEPIYGNDVLEKHFVLNLRGKALEQFQDHTRDWKAFQESYKPPKELKR